MAGNLEADRSEMTESLVSSQVLRSVGCLFFVFPVKSSHALRVSTQTSGQGQMWLWRGLTDTQGV
jgi:hypothetical protein